MSDIFDIFKRIEKKREDTPLLPINYLVVGLGNPGARYQNTRHNAGFLCMDAICRTHHATVDRSKYHALVGEAMIAGQRVLLMKPQTLMNASGIAVSEAASFYKIPPERIVVLCDDINLAVGQLRVRKNGSDGGQKGLRSIINMIGSDAFPRIRIGVGQKPHPDYDLADWVLSDFSKAENEVLSGCFGTAIVGLEKLIQGNPDEAMQICNRRK